MELSIKKPLSKLYLATFIIHLADYIIIPILPILLSIEKGFSPVQIGILIGTGALSFQFGSIIGGIISDNISRKITLMTGAFIAAITLIGFGQSESFMTLVFFWTSSSVGSGFFSPTIKASISDFCKKTTDGKTNAFSRRGISANLGVAIGGLIPLLIFNLPFQTFFYISAIFYISLFFLSMFIPNHNDNQSFHKPRPKHFTLLFKNKPYLIFSLITVFVWAIYAQLRILLPLRASVTFTNTKLVGSIWSIMSFFAVIFQTYMTKYFIKNLHLFTSIMLGTILLGTGILLIGFSYSYPLLLLSALIFIIGEMLNTPSIDSMTSELAKEEIIGAYFSFSNMSYGIGSAIGSYLGGSLISAYGILSLTPWLTIFIFSISIVFLMFLIKRTSIIKNALK